MATVVIQQPTEVIESRDHGLFVKSRIFQTRDVNLTAMSIDLYTCHQFQFQFQLLHTVQHSHMPQLVMSHGQWVCACVHSLHYTIDGVKQWRYGYSVGLALEGSRVWLPLGHCWRNKLTQVVQTLVPLSSSSISWYRCKNREGNGRLQKRCGLPLITVSVSSLPA